MYVECRPALLGDVFYSLVAAFIKNVSPPQRLWLYKTVCHHGISLQTAIFSKQNACISCKHEHYNFVQEKIYTKNETPVTLLENFTGCLTSEATMIVSLCFANNVEKPYMWQPFVWLHKLILY